MSDKKLIGTMLACGYIILFAYLFLQGYLLGDATFWMGICLAPYVLVSSVRQKQSWRSTTAVLFLLILCFFARATSLRYLLVIVSVVFMIETLNGKLDSLFIWLLLIISPLFRYISEVFTFPIRMHLSKWGGAILKVTGFSAESSGNIIQMNGNDFAVDPACMGLQMMGFSFLIGIFLISHCQKITGARITLASTIVILLLIFILNVLSNLMRIITLVIFSIAAENPMHDLAGIFSLLIYVLLPAVLLIKSVFKRFGTANVTVSEKLPPARFALASNVIVFSLCCLFVLQRTHLNIRKVGDSAILTDPKYKVVRLENGITRYRSPDALIYVKGIPDFYSTDHNPYLCWKGSGYTFTSVREEIISGRIIYFGTLKKGKTELQTAWWFANESHITISQLDWRWRVLKGEPSFQLINVTAETKLGLKTTVQQWM